jgi:hypothetical protein
MAFNISRQCSDLEMLGTNYPMMQCQIPVEWELQSLVLYSGNTAKVLKNHRLLQMVAENIVKNTCRKQNTYMSHTKLSIIRILLLTFIVFF